MLVKKITPSPHLSVRRNSYLELGRKLGLGTQVIATWYQVLETGMVQIAIYNTGYK